MLGRSREAHDPTDKRVVATVGTPIALRKQLIKTMRRPLSPTGRHFKAQRP
jgi:hypothetical protein